MFAEVDRARAEEDFVSRFADQGFICDRCSAESRFCIRCIKDIANEIDWNRGMQCDVSHTLTAVEA